MQIVASYPDYALFLAPEGDTTLSLHRREGTAAEPGASIHFEVDDMDHTVAELSQAGFAFLLAPRQGAALSMPPARRSHLA